MQTRTRTISLTDTRLGAIVTALLAISFLVTIAGGIWLNTALRDDDGAVEASLRVWHLVSGLSFIVFGCIHVWLNRTWYIRLLQVEPRNWYGVAQYRLMPIFTMLFAAVAITGPLIGLGLTGLISFHQGCGLLMAVFAIGHIADRIRSIFM